MKKKQADISPDIEKLLNEEFTAYILSPIDYLYYIATKEERDDLDTYRDTMHETIDKLFEEGKTEEYRQLMDEYIKVFENKVNNIFSRHFNNIIGNPDAIIKDAKELTVKYLKAIRSFCLFLLTHELPFKRAEVRYYKEDNTVLIDYNMFYGQRENLFPYHYARMKELNRAQELDQGIANAINESFCCNDPDDEEGILGFDFYTIFKESEIQKNKETRFKREETRFITADSSFYNNLFNVKPIEKPLEFPVYVYENNKDGKPPERIPQLVTVAPNEEYYKEMGLPTLSEFSLQTLEDVCNMIIEKPENHGKIKFTISQLVTKSTGSADTRDNIKLATSKYWELKQLSGIWILDITTGTEKRLLNINFKHTGKSLLQTTVNVIEESPFLPIMIKLHHAFKDEIMLPENKKKTYNNLVIIGFLKRRIIFAKPEEPYFIYYEDLEKHLTGKPRKSRIMKDLADIFEHLKELEIIKEYSRTDQARKDGYIFTVKGERTKRLLKNSKN